MAACCIGYIDLCKSRSRLKMSARVQKKTCAAPSVKPKTAAIQKKSGKLCWVPWVARMQYGLDSCRKGFSGCIAIVHACPV